MAAFVLLGVALLAQDIDRLWDDLATEDPSVAYEAVWALAQLKDGRALRERLVPRVDLAQIRAHLADLASEDLVRRAAAHAGLLDAGLHAEDVLRTALREARQEDTCVRLSEEAATLLK